MYVYQEKEKRKRCKGVKDKQKESKTKRTNKCVINGWIWKRNNRKQVN